MKKTKCRFSKPQRGKRFYLNIWNHWKYSKLWCLSCNYDNMWKCCYENVTNHHPNAQIFSIEKKWNTPSCCSNIVNEQIRPVKADGFRWPKLICLRWRDKTLEKRFSERGAKGQISWSQNRPQKEVKSQKDVIYKLVQSKIVARLTTQAFPTQSTLTFNNKNGHLCLQSGENRM